MHTVIKPLLHGPHIFRLKQQNKLKKKTVIKSMFIHFAYIKLLLHRVYMFIMWNFSWKSDCSYMEASHEEVALVEVSALARSALWCDNGDIHIYSCLFIVLVPFCIDIPNPSSVQPGIQQRSGDLPHPCRKQSQHWALICYTFVNMF